MSFHQHWGVAARSEQTTGKTLNKLKKAKLVLRAINDGIELTGDETKKQLIALILDPPAGDLTESLARALAEARDVKAVAKMKREGEKRKAEKSAASSKPTGEEAAAMKAAEEAATAREHKESDGGETASDAATTANTEG